MSYAPLSAEQRELLLKYVAHNYDHHYECRDAASIAILEIDNLRSELAAAMTVVDAAQKWGAHDMARKWDSKSQAEHEAAWTAFTKALDSWTRRNAAAHAGEDVAGTPE